MRKSFILAVVCLMAFAPGLRFAQAESLDDAIDAELDEVSKDDVPKTEPTAKSSALDDVQLDEGEDAAPKQTAKAAPEPAPPEASPDASPNQGLVDDELKLDDKPDDKADEPTLDAAKPSDEPAPDLEAEKSAPAALEPAPVVEEKAVETKPSGVALDPANSEFEKKLGRISKGYKQVPDVNWDEIIGERRQENYRLQRGDTLWDISQTFFGDGFFWAKLWSQNGAIGNPHQIMRGKGIRFVAGTESDAPAIGVMDVQKNVDVVTTNPFEAPDAERPTYREEVQTQVTSEEIESGVVLETDELIPSPELPPPDKRIPLLKTLPKSFGEARIETDGDYDISGLKGAPAVQANVAPSVFVNSLILDGAPDEVGKVDEIEAQERVAAVGQGVFVRANKEFAIGKRLTFIRRREQASGAAGSIVDVEGVGVVDGVIKENSNTYHVTITTALFPVEIGSLVIEEPPPRVTISRDGRHADAHVKIVGGEFAESRRVLGMPSVIYLNGGSTSGLQKGDILGVEAKRGTRRDTRYPDLIRSIAVIKVADVRQKVATAIVLHSTEEIMIGDLTSGDLPEDLPSLHAETADESATAFGRKEPIDIK